MKDVIFKDNREIIFHGLRFNTSFNFKNKKQEAKYWDNLLIKNPANYRLEFNQYLDEKLHVIFSFYKIYNYLFYFFLIFILLAPKDLFLLNAGMMAVIGIITTVYYFKFQSFARAVEITKTIHTLEFVEELRKIILEHKFINKTKIKN